MDLVNAQQARRALDYLVGFNLSPLLWKKVRRGLSAGRVQSPALRMICERDEAIDAFKPQEYWTIEAEGEHSEVQFPLKLVEYAGKKVGAVQLHQRARGARRRSRAEQGRRRQAHRRHHRPQAAQAQSGAAVHHFDAAAGSRAQAGLLRPAHHAPRAAAV